MRGILIYFVLFISSGELFSQLPVDSIDLNRIPQRKIRHFLIQERQNQVQYLTDFKPSCRDNADTCGFSIMQNTYLIKEKLEDVWNAYRNTSIAKAWNGKLTSLGLTFSKWSNQIFYGNDGVSNTIDTGQVFLIDLHLLHGLYNLPVGMQILNIDNVTFSYLEGGKSRGIQIIRFLEDVDGFTRIIHISAFKSNSAFRDKHLYPFFHTKVLNEFHKNILSAIIKNPDEFVITPDQ